MIFRIIVSLALLPIFFHTIAMQNPGDKKAAGKSDLYFVSVESHTDADILSQTGIAPLIRTTRGYLVLIRPEKSAGLLSSGLKCNPVTFNVDRRQLALDISHGQSNRGRYPIVYEENGLTLYRVEPDILRSVGKENGLAPVGTGNLKIFYKDPLETEKRMQTPDLGLDIDSLVGLVSRDSMESYSYALQVFDNRPVGSSANHQCANWIMGKFQEFGYDSVVYDPFCEDGWWEESLEGKNVIAYKVGTTYPHDHIIICAHYDGVGRSPAADDNGSGVASVMEMARILVDIETNMTIVFALWDAEENGLVGSQHYATEFAERQDRIVFVLNLDMIGFEDNQHDALLYHGPVDYYAALWSRMADSLTGIDLNGNLTISMHYNCSYSDQQSFLSFGCDAMCAFEQIFNSEYHQPSDSTSYLDFDYMTRMTMASLATVYYVDASFIPEDKLFFSCPEDFPYIIDPGAVPVIRVHVDEYAGAVLSQNSVYLNYRVDNETLNSKVMTSVGGNIFEAELPLLSCGNLIAYYITAIEELTGRIYHFPGIESPFYSIMTAAVDTVLDDDFQIDRGWTVSGDASAGIWDRYLAGANSADPKNDYDGSGKCYLTDHGVLSDVDNGATFLQSPSFDISNGKATIEYAFWYDNGTSITGKSDIFRIYLHDGSDWIQIDSAGPEAGAYGEWIYRKFWVHELCDASDSIRLGFEASDAVYDSYVEAAVDAVKIVFYSKAPYIFTDSIPDKLFGSQYNLQLDAAGCTMPLTWADKYGDLIGTGLTLSEDGLFSGLPSDTGEIAFTVLLEDAEGVSVEKQYSPHVWLSFICGDAGMDYQLNIGDAVYLINFIFKGGQAPYPVCVGDANGDGETDVGDAVYLINHIFKSGPPPPDGCCPL